jgi:hypothetical protein
VVPEPRAVLTFDERPARLADFRVGTAARINFSVRNRQTDRGRAERWPVIGPDVETDAGRLGA